MPWKSVSIMENRREFVRLALQGGVSVAELSRRFGISRQTGFTLLRRHREEGDKGLEDRSRRPHSSPRRSPDAVEIKVLALRKENTDWGGRKLSRRLKDIGTEGVPAPSTITEILRRHGKLDPAEAAKHRPVQRFERPAPNDLWQMDFKGHVAMDHGRCHPLTVLDDHSRYALGLAACGDETLDTVQRQLSGVFRRHGLPLGILCDNGSPWGGSGSAGPTAFEVWLMRVGVRVHHGRPYHPQTQGKDERFHRTLKVGLLQGRRLVDLDRAQVAFDAWRRKYNEERPHEALSLDVPASRYRVSPVCFPETLPAPEYYSADHVRRVSHDGAVRFRGRRLKISQAFAGMDVALRPGGTDDIWHLFFMRFGIYEVDLRVSDGGPAMICPLTRRLSPV